MIARQVLVCAIVSLLPFVAAAQGKPPIKPRAKTPPRAIPRFPARFQRRPRRFSRP